MDIYFCARCKEAKFKDEFPGKKTRHRYCRPCNRAYQTERRNSRHKSKDNPLAYMSVIRCRYKKTLYKYSPENYNIPDGYELIYKIFPGYLLPPKYKNLDSYDLKTTT